MVGGSTPRRSASTQVISSTAPAAAIRWPIMLLLLLTGVLQAASPNTFLMASDSTRSLTCVLVPWALT